MDIRQLRYFLAVVDHGGVTRAAQHLHISQPSLSQAVKTLEAQLGVVLFHRVGRSLRLSTAGESLVGPARASLRQFDSVAAAARELRDGQHGTVEIVAMPSPAVEPLTGLIAGFAESHPGISVQVSAAFTAEEVLEAVRTGGAELGLTASAKPIKHPELATQEVAQQSLVLVLNPQVKDFAVRADQVVAADQLAGARVVVSKPGSLMRTVVDSWRADGVDVTVAVETDHRSSILPLVSAGVGHALLPSAWTETAHRLGLSTRVVADTPVLRITTVARHDGLTPAAQRFLAVAHREMLGESQTVGE
ncbi:LysR family transcriptional regulator [Kocuria sp.]|uniref:LysR family transcriptional regulator n=1 Tax=Kocuria sp. TaxID=1871328 RepID=UPI0026DF17D1|nr:LysR family transcriptional regulator [Kocuria sp.]MDO5618342.1 LysR family transcriptional regulator [Kocuria sp.]